jgi:hypothetical protein
MTRRASNAAAEHPKWREAWARAVKVGGNRDGPESGSRIARAEAASAVEDAIRKALNRADDRNEEERNRRSNG